MRNQTLRTRRRRSTSLIGRFIHFCDVSSDIISSKCRLFSVVLNMLKFTDVIGSRTSFIRRVSQVYFLKELCSQVAAIAWTHVTAQGQSF